MFIDKNVYGEYQTFSKNRTAIEAGTLSLEYASVDSVNVFKFIDAVSSTALKTFERIEEIEQYLKSQISAMFYQYLNGLQNYAKDTEVLNAVSEIKNVSERMNLMVQELGKQLLPKDDKQGYQQIINTQNKILIDFYIDYFKTYIKVRTRNLYDVGTPESDFRKYATLLYHDYFKSHSWNDYDKMDFKKRHSIHKALVDKVFFEFKKIDNEISSLVIEDMVYGRFKSIIEPVLQDNKNLEELFIDKLTRVLYNELVVLQLF